jgi:hypothetical protein
MAINFDLDERIKTLLLITPNNPEKTTVDTEFRTAAGDWATFIAAAPIAALADAIKTKLEWANTLGNWSLVIDAGTGNGKDDTALVGKVLEDAPITTLRSLAIKYGLADLVKLVKTATGVGTPEARKRAVELRNRLFTTESTAVLAKMVEDKEIVVGDDSRDALIAFLKDTVAFKFEEVKEEELKPDLAILGSIPADKREAAIVDLKNLDLMQDLSPTPDIVLALYDLEFDIRAKLATLALVEDATEPQKKLIRAAFGKVSGDLTELLKAVKPDLGDDLTAKLTWINSLGDWSHTIDEKTKKTFDDAKLVEQVKTNADATSFRELGRKYSVDRIAQILNSIKPAEAAPAAAAPGGGDPSSTPGGVLPEIYARAKELRRRTYQSKSLSDGKQVACRTPVIQRMIEDREIPFDQAVSGAILGFLNGKPEFDFVDVTDSDLDDDAPLLASIEQSIRPQVANQLLTLKQVERMSTTPDAVVQLFSSGLTSPATIVQIPEAEFVTRFSASLGEDVAKAIYAEATKLAKEQQASQPNIARRIASFNAAIEAFDPGNDKLKGIVADALRDKNAVWGDAAPVIEAAQVSAEVMKKLNFANEAAEWSEDRTVVVGNLLSQWNKFKKIEDVAKKLNLEEIADLLNEPAAAGFALAPAAAAPGGTGTGAELNVARTLRTRLYSKFDKTVANAVLEKMVGDGDLAAPDSNIKAGVLQFLRNQSDFDFRTTSVRVAFAKPGAFSNIAPELHAPVRRELESISRTQSLGINASPTFAKTGLSSFAISEMPQATFVARFGKDLGGEEEARQVHKRAVDNRMRNEYSLMAIREAVRGTGFGLLDKDPHGKDETLAERVKRLSIEIQNLMTDQGQEPLPNLQTLFGSIDTCECGHCNSVYSPSSYFVELLNFLRNNNLDLLFIARDISETDFAQLNSSSLPESVRYGFVANQINMTAGAPVRTLIASRQWTASDGVKSYLLAKQGNSVQVNVLQDGIIGTPLENLFRRRPDLGNLQLTCENTNTVLPYIDLANEVMESFIVHLEQYRNSNPLPEMRQATIDVHDVDDETSGELLAQPQFTNYEAYCKLSKSVFPFTLPYHQPIDSIRISLEYLKTSRHEVFDAFRRAPLKRSDDPIKKKCFPNYLSDAEYGEYVDLHKLRLDRAYEAEYLGLTEDEYTILCKESFWKKRFFELADQKPYTDIEYLKKVGVREPYEYYGFADEAGMLASLPFVKKYFLNRTGVAYAELIDLLQTLTVNPLSPKGRTAKYFKKLKLASLYRYIRSLVDEVSQEPEQRFRLVMQFLKSQFPDLFGCEEDERELREWIYCRFEKLGGLIVLNMVAPVPVGTILNIQDFPIGRLNEDSTITHAGQQIGQVLLDGSVVKNDGTPFTVNELRIRDVNGNLIGWIKSDGLYVNQDGAAIRWEWQPIDQCDIRNVRLEHLDGSIVVSEEYDRIHRFIRLWRKLGWTIDETDKAVVGLTPTKNGCRVPDAKAGKDDCGTTMCGSECEDDPRLFDINPEMLSQLVSVKKVLALTGMDVIKQLTFWGEISTFGDKSLYRRLFLTHNLKAIDNVFKADEDNNYLADPDAKLTEHHPVLMASLRLKEFDVTDVVRFRHLADHLSLDNVSTLYRHSLLAKHLSVRPGSLEQVIAAFGDPFESASATYEFLTLWQRMESAGLSIDHLSYIFKGTDNLTKPVGIQQVAMLRTKKSIFDGLLAIDKEHADLAVDPDPSSHSSAVVQAKAALLFEQSLVGAIVGLIEGTTVYTTNAPTGLTIVIPEEVDPAVPSTLPSAKSLKKKLKYVDSNGVATLQITGILTVQELEDAKKLAGGNRKAKEWKDAVDRAGRQPIHFFNMHLAKVLGVDPVELPGRTVAGAAFDSDSFDEPSPYCLLQGDVDVESANVKRRAFLTGFLPYLRSTLSKRLVVETIAGLFGLKEEQSLCLLTDIIVDATKNQPAINTLLQIKDQQSVGEWRGWLAVTTEARFRFFAINDGAQAASFDLQFPDGTVRSIAFANQQEDPNNVWYSDEIQLPKSLYRMRVPSGSPEKYEWQTETAARSPIPSTALLPDCVDDETAVFQKLDKAAIIVNSYKLDFDEITFWNDFTLEGQTGHFNSLSFAFWKKLQSYAAFRDSLPKCTLSLVSLFRWAKEPTRFPLLSSAPVAPGVAPNADEILSERIALATSWKQDDIANLISVAHFDLQTKEAFTDESNLLKLQKALQLRNSTSVSLDRLFDWAEPSSHFGKCRRIADDIRATIRARFDQESWEQVVKPLNDQLRSHQRDALIAYLLVQNELTEWGITDSDGLFEFFLIDTKMEPCMETSRMKQAISSVQLFIHRVLIGFEEKYGVPPTAVDRKRWEWMQKYRVWEANRKVFLYPENWIRSELRDDKSEFFGAFQSSCLQDELTLTTFGDALRKYVSQVNDVANLRIVGLFAENSQVTPSEVSFDRLFLFARSRNEPYQYWFRRYDAKSKSWNPWASMAVDVPVYGPSESRDGFIVPVVWRNRMLLLAPRIDARNDSPTLEVWSQHYHFQSGTWPDPAFKSQWEPASNQERADFPDAINSYEPGILLESEMKTNESRQLVISLGLTDLQDGKSGSKVLSNGAIVDAAYRVAKIEVKQILTSAIRNLNRGPGAPSVDGDEGVGRFSKRVVWYRPYAIANYAFTTRETISGISITLSHAGSPRQGFQFDGTELRRSWAGGSVPSQQTSFHYSGSLLRPLQGELLGAPAPFVVDSNSYGTTVNLKSPAAGERRRLGNQLAPELLFASRLESTDAIFEYFERLPQSVLETAFGGIGPKMYHELKQPNAIYNWETAFHAPMLACEMFLKAQRFDEAIQMIHHVFDPLAKGTGMNRYWRFRPFQSIDASSTISQLFLNLKAGEANEAITAWRDNPFQPHLVARDRPSSYMKWVVMKYIEILIAYGDYYFRQNTLEAIPLALQYYITASHIFGPAPQTIPKRGEIKPQTYNTLLDQWDAFGNALVELELRFPNSYQVPAANETPSDEVQTANVFGFASTLYFCIPDNPKLKELRDLIDDRMFKIRHCQDINGVFRKLPLFEPPIDPALLVQAAAQGLSLSSVLDDMKSPMPNYRFVYLLQKALELCSEVKALANAFISAKEKKDAEVISQLRSRHESSIQKLVMEARKIQVEESKLALDAAIQNRKGPEYRLRHYLQLIGGDLGSLPDTDADFTELQNLIDGPVDESGLKISQREKEELDKAKEAADWQTGIGAVETLASALHYIPTIGAHFQPLGPGASISFGGSNLGSAMQAIARGLRIQADRLSYDSSRASRLGGFQRQIQDRIQQANIAGHEIKNVDKQVLTQRIRIAMADQEIKNQQKQIDNAAEVEEFLRSKYSNEELYSYMEGELRKLHYTAYTIAYEMARKAEKVFQFERGLSTSDFIKPGYWEQGRDGLFAGERLYQSLKRLEAAYLENRGYDFEVTKHVSLRQLNPLALLALRETGTCEFELPEILFDLDYPGHFKRRIKSVSLTVPCVTGPHTSVNCTLRLLNHSFRHKAQAATAKAYPRKFEEDDDRFMTVNTPITSIAVSDCRNDAGVFELNFRDERYIPFEGAGAISKWRFELPPTEIKQFDYSTISDVIMQVRYTSVDGGDTLRSTVVESVKNRLNSVEGLARDEGVFAILDLKHDFATEWSKFSNAATTLADRKMSLGSIIDRLPYLASNWGGDPEKVVATDVFLISPQTENLKSMAFKLVQSSGPSDFSEASVVNLPCLAILETKIKSNNWELQRTSLSSLNGAWLVIRLRLIRE